MNEYNNDVFRFENYDDENMEQSNFNYNDIGGLGESNYENEDLFKVEEEPNVNGYNNMYAFDNVEENNFYDNQEIFSPAIDNQTNTFKEESKIEKDSAELDQEFVMPINDYSNVDALETFDTQEEPAQEQSDINTLDISNNETIPNDEQEDINNRISISDTPTEELNKLTEYESDEIESTNINELFDRVSVNVKDASDIFRKNTEMKQKIDFRFDELKKLQSEVENAKKTQIDEINQYKEEVLNKLNEKKEEIEKRLNTLKEVQSSLEKEKKEFEEYKRQEKSKIEKIQKEVQSAYDDRREELGHIEDVLRRQKDSLDEERNKLSLDKIQYESDKNDLANNLLKFNELVNSFTNGVNEVEE